MMILLVLMMMLLVQMIPMLTHSVVAVLAGRKGGYVTVRIML
jgi:hypothetical protein